MTRYEAWKKANATWGDGRRRRYGLVCLRRKNVIDRCVVGYFERARPVVKGRGPTWEAAFADADRH